MPASFVMLLRPHQQSNPCATQSAAARLKAPTFRPLGANERLAPGTLFAIDTEFVAHSPPDKAFKGCALMNEGLPLSCFSCGVS